jgi:hypothetical protein
MREICPERRRGRGRREVFRRRADAERRAEGVVILFFSARLERYSPSTLSGKVAAELVGARKRSAEASRVVPECRSFRGRSPNMEWGGVRFGQKAISVNRVRSPGAAFHWKADREPVALPTAQADRAPDLCTGKALIDQWLFSCA